MIRETSHDMNSPSIMSMMIKPLRNKSIKIQLVCQYAQLWKVIMPPSLPMDRQVPVKPTPWKDLSTVWLMNLEVSFLEPYKISSNTFKAVKMGR